MKTLLYSAYLSLFVLASCAVAHVARAQELVPTSTQDADAVIASLPDLARKTMAVYREEDRATSLGTLFRLQSLAGDHRAADASLDALIRLRDAANPGSAAPLRVFQVSERAQIAREANRLSSEASVQRAFKTTFEPLSDLEANRSLFWLKGDVDRFRNDLRTAAGNSVGKTRLPLADAIDLIRKAHFLSTYEAIAPLADALIEEDDARRYVIDTRLSIATPDNADISAISVRPRNTEEKRPTLLVFTIYADDGPALTEARTMAAHGYAGMVAYTRGKGRSPQTPVPFEHDGDDARAVIDWIARQPWSDGRVGMYGGSYNGFTQWAVTKKLPKALKTIVPYVANNPGNGLPMENNVFPLVNYAWPFYTTNNQFLDNDTYFDHARWSALNERWYASGRAYRDVDKVDGTPNPWFQRWLQHPTYDAYWRRMTPYRREFAKIDIPVLTITGYFDDGQLSAVDYMRQHYAYKPDAEHYLLIGPYDHIGAQAPRKPKMFRGYAIDTVAQMDTPEITFQWMDYIFRNGNKPALIQDKVNYQVMGANVWKHAPSIAAMSVERAALYLSAQRSDVGTGADAPYTLAERPDTPSNALTQRIDFADRSSSFGDHHPDPVIGKALDASSGLVFVSAPFDQPVEVSGMFSGELHITINKRDVDFSVTLYEHKSSGELFYLSHFLGRASHADSMEKRRLLTPGKRTIVRFDRTRMTSRKLEPGSRLLAAVTVNKNAYSQINYGSGKDVSDESIDDAAAPLQMQWHTDSRIIVPLSK
jgi:uncharacterized protein